MRLLIFLLMVAMPVLAQGPASILNSACGPAKESFHVELNHKKHTPPAAIPGKARVIFVQDLGNQGPVGLVGGYITKVGMDGKWIGAEKNNSWFSVDVDPGVHHLCANAQLPFSRRFTELVHFSAEAGHDYYFRIRNLSWQVLRIDFGPVDSDQALYMIDSSPLSTAHLKK